MSQAPVPNQVQPQLAPAPPSNVPAPRRPSPIQEQISAQITTKRVSLERIEVTLEKVIADITTATGELDVVQTIHGPVLGNLLQGRPPQFGQIGVPGQVFRTGNVHLDTLEDNRRTLRNAQIRVEKELEDLDIQLIIVEAVPDQVARGLLNTSEDLEEAFGRHMNVPGVREVAQRSLDRAIDTRERRVAKTGLTPQEALSSILGPRNITVYGLMTLTTTPDLLGFVQNLRSLHCQWRPRV